MLQKIEEGEEWIIWEAIHNDPMLLLDELGRDGDGRISSCAELLKKSLKSKKIDIQPK